MLVRKKDKFLNIARAYKWEVLKTDMKFYFHTGRTKIMKNNELLLWSHF